jgi:YVTN family beta-propeller protein
MRRGLASTVSRIILLITLALTLALCGCGGGGSGSSPVAAAPTDGSGGDTNAPSSPAAASTYTLFESGQVRPLAWSAEGDMLFVVNTPANRLDIFSFDGSSLEPKHSVSVGLEPVAVAVRDSGEVWVVNHLSDSVSIVDVSGNPRVTRTLLVGDEPRDIVFAGTGERRLAFISAAFRGQNHPGFDPEDLTRPGIGRADVWVYEADKLDRGDLNGGPLTILNLFTDSLRALEALPNGSRVYAAAFLSGNRSTILDAFAVRGKKPPPSTNVDGIEAPQTGLIVKNTTGAWVDEAGTDWSEQVRFDLPDYDVFEIDASGEVPVVLRRVSGVGTILFNMAVNPARGELYVSNLEARNHVRFEGPGETASTVRGHIADTRISVLTNSGVQAVDLNPHVNFDREEGSPVPPEEAARSLSQVTSLAVSADGTTLYTAAFGSGKLAFLDLASLTSGSYNPDSGTQLQLPGGGPSGLALHPGGKLLALYTRFDHSVVLVDTEARSVVSGHPLYSPEPEHIKAGRKFLYDAALTSANGVNACSSCHIFADNDGLAWDLGNPDAPMQANPNQFVSNSPVVTTRFHPMKGPMTTQTLRGIADSGPQHWRGDRTGQERATTTAGPESQAAAAFKEFNSAFVGLVGRERELSAQEMQQLTDFAMALTPPPNPIRNLDNSLTSAQQAGRDIYFNVDNITGIGSCNHCHALDPLQKQFGTGGLMSFEGGRIAEDFKIPHLRNAYSKVGMFGSSSPNSDGRFMGDQVRGFGYLHDGAIDTLDHFFSDPVFRFPAPVEQNRADVIRFVMAMDSNLAPIVGQQITLAGDEPAVLARVALLEQRALVKAPRPECLLVVTGIIEGTAVQLQMTGEDTYIGSNGSQYSAGALREAARTEGQELTFTCHPPG